jgi:ADP-heptose:LPS heptosyltransferase
VKIVMADKPVWVGEACLRPYCRYIVSDWEAMHFMNHSRHTQWQMSSFNAWERRYGGQDLKGKKVCIYRHSAWGDQLMVSAIPVYLKTLYPEAIVHLYCEADVVTLWEGNPVVGGCAIPLPIPFDVARAYDYHIFYEGILENNSEHDQNNCYDDMFGMIGLTDVPDVFKRPRIIPRASDYVAINALKLDRGNKYMVYHVSPANKNRCYPVDQGISFINKFLRHYTDWNVVLVGVGAKDYPELKDLARKWDSRVINLLDKTKEFRAMIPIIERASLLVCPDSSIMHLAASFAHVPVISLWGLFAPEDRSKYYPNHYALVAQGVCPHAPCRNHEFELPRHKCQDAMGFDKDSIYCPAIAAIDPDNIMAKAREILG